MLLKSSINFDFLINPKGWKVKQSKTKSSLCERKIIWVFLSIFKVSLAVSKPFNSGISISKNTKLKYLANNKATIAKYSTLKLDIFIPEEYNNAGGVWYASTISGSVVTQISEIQYRQGNGTMTTGWITITITKATHAAVWENGFTVIQINRVESSNANLIIGSIYGE